jgi:hypothetical protein
MTHVTDSCAAHKANPAPTFDFQPPTASPLAGRDLDKITRLRVRLPGPEGAEGETITVRGRAAWALAALIQAGAAGCTPLNRPAPRWSHYVFTLRGVGVPVETVTEGHGGPYSGHHARYVIRAEMVVLGADFAEGGRP